MKENINTEYLSKTKKVLEIKLKSKKYDQQNKYLAVSSTGYSELFLNWTTEELINFNCKMMLIIHKILNLKNNIFYVKSKVGGDDFFTGFDLMNLEKQDRVWKINYNSQTL